MLSFLSHPLQRSNQAIENPLLINSGAITVEFLTPTSPQDVFLIRITRSYKEMLKKTAQGISPAFGPPYHWHWNQVEVFKVEKGAAIFTIDGKSRRITPNDGLVTIPTGAYHTYDVDPESQEDLVLLIWAYDKDGTDEAFFRNMFCYMSDCKKNNVKPDMFQMLLFLHAADVSLAMPSLPRWLGKIVSKWGLGFVGGKVIGEWLLGYKSSYKEYVDMQNCKDK